MKATTLLAYIAVIWCVLFLIAFPVACQYWHTVAPEWVMQKTQPDAPGVGVLMAEVIIYLMHYVGGAMCLFHISNERDRSKRDGS